MWERGGRSRPEGDEDDRQRLRDALAHAKRKIVALQEALASRRRERGEKSAPGFSGAPPDGRAASDLEIRLAAQQAAIAAPAPTMDPTGRLWPGLDPRLTVPAEGLPLRVATASARPAMVRNLRDARVLVGNLGEIDEPDLLVFPLADRSDELAQIAGDVPPELWARAAEGRTKLVFDASLEGIVHGGVRTNLIHELIREHSVSSRHAVYLTQDRGYGEAYARYCAGAGLTPMQVWIYDHYVQSLFLSLEQEGARMFEEGLSRQLELGPRRARRFLSMNFYPRPTKVLFLLSLLKDGLWNEGFISFAGFDWLRTRGVTPKEIAAGMLDLPGFRDMVRERLAWMGELEKAGPLLLGVEGSTDPKSVDRMRAIQLAEYRQSWFTVVPETEMSDRLHRITEKPFKPLLNFHPLLVLGSPGSLRLIRAYGFQTFEGLFDEAYDDEPEPRRRFEMVYGQLVRFCRMDEAELASRIDTVREQLVFNARWGFVELPVLFRRRIDADMVSRLIAFALA